MCMSILSDCIYVHHVCCQGQKEGIGPQKPVMWPSSVVIGLKLGRKEAEKRQLCTLKRLANTVRLSLHLNQLVLCPAQGLHFPESHTMTSYKAAPIEGAVR